MSVQFTLTFKNFPRKYNYRNLEPQQTKVEYNTNGENNRIFLGGGGCCSNQFDLTSFPNKDIELFLLFECIFASKW